MTKEQLYTVYNTEDSDERYSGLTPIDAGNIYYSERKYKSPNDDQPHELSDSKSLDWFKHGLNRFGRWTIVTDEAFAIEMARLLNENEEEE